MNDNGRRPLSYRIWLAVGLTLGGAHFLWLFGQAFFTDGRLAADWLETIPWVLIAGSPTVIAFTGTRSREALLAAAVISLPVAFLSLASALLPLLVPAIFYLLAWASYPHAVTRE